MVSGVLARTTNVWNIGGSRQGARAMASPSPNSIRSFWSRIYIWVFNYFNWFLILLVIGISFLGFKRLQNYNTVCRKIKQKAMQNEKSVFWIIKGRFHSPFWLIYCKESRQNVIPAFNTFWRFWNSEKTNEKWRILKSLKLEKI